MAYIPPQLAVDTERENRRIGFMNQAMSSFGEIAKAREQALEREKAAKKAQAAEDMNFAEKGVSPEMVAEYRKTGDAKGIQKFFSDAYANSQQQKEAKRLADEKLAGVDLDYKKSQIAKNNAEAAEASGPIEETKAFKEYVAKKEYDNKNLKQGKNAQEFDSRMQNILGEAEQLKSLIKKNGTYEMFGPHNAQLAQKVDAIAIDAAKLFDPESVARDSEVAAFRKMLFEPGSMTTSNSTAIGTVDGFKKLVQDRAARSRGEALVDDNSQGAPATTPVRPEVKQALAGMTPQQKQALRDQLRQKALAGGQ